MDDPEDDANLPHSTQGAQVVSQAGKLERQEASVKDMTQGCSKLCHPRKPPTSCPVYIPWDAALGVNDDG